MKNDKRFTQRHKNRLKQSESGKSDKSELDLPGKTNDLLPRIFSQYQVATINNESSKMNVSRLFMTETKNSITWPETNWFMKHKLLTHCDADVASSTTMARC